MNKIAHKREDGTEQLLIDHLKNTASLTQEFSSHFDSGEIGWTAGLLHDIGKYSTHFQNRIRDREKYPAHDHATAGAKESDFEPVMFAIAGHHGSLPDGGDKDDPQNVPTLWGRMKKELDDYSDWKKEIDLPDIQNIQIPLFLQKATTNFTWAFYTRMLFSSLVDADFLDTEHFMNGQTARGKFDSISELHEKLHKHFSKPVYTKSELNDIRGEILLACQEKANHDTGLFSLTVPTGGGKTLSSLAFALEHAKKHGLRRVIYVIPYTSIIDQTAEIFSDIFGKNQVIEHHSSVEIEENPIESNKDYKRLACENWDAPIIITTAVQFFESLFASKPSQCRKLHNIAKSVVIFDEAQTILFPNLHPCVAGISELVKHYHCTSVLCTATQPELQGIFDKFSLSIEEIIPNKEEIFQKLKRCTVENYGTCTWKKLGEELSQLSQVLVIVNHRKSAKTLWEQLPKEGSYCLSTLLYPKHRKELFIEIRQRLKDELPCRVVSTSLIEAGVDLDFPLVFREIAGLDSILQAAGRCNREGKRPIEESILYYFKSEESIPKGIQQNVDSFTEISKMYTDVTALDAISSYFNLLWYLKGDENLDKNHILDAFEKGISGNKFPFLKVADSFRLLESSTIPVYIPLEGGENGGESLVQQLKTGSINRDLYRKLGQFSVNLYEEQLNNLIKTGAVTKTEKGDMILSDISLYHKKTGLTLESETGNALFI